LIGVALPHSLHGLPTMGLMPVLAGLIFIT
jgi:hypothetical protein